MKLRDSASPSFSNKIALITGGGRGIGAATAQLLASLGARVAIMSRTPQELLGVSKKIESLAGSDRCLVLTGDVSRPEDVKAAFEQIKKTWGSIDILVNNAGMILNKRLEEMLANEWDQLMAVNLRGTFLCTQQAFLQIKEAKKTGSIVNLSSLGGLRHTEKFPGFSAYTTSKHGVVGFTEACAAEGKPFGIRVNCVAPGAVDTLMLKQAAPGLKTKTLPEEIAQVIVYLCDESRSKAITGAVIEVNTNE